MTEGTGGPVVHTHDGPPVPVAEASGRRAVAAVLVSAVVPGLGHRLLGLRRAAAVRLAITAATLLALGIAAAAFAADPSALVASATSTRAVLAGGLIGTALGLLWASAPIAAAVHAGRRRRAGRAALALAAAVAVAVPLGATAWWAAATSAQHTLLSSVFASGRGPAPVDGRYNILLMGVDADPIRDQVLLPDSLTLASIDAVSGRTVLLGIPRTAANFLYPEGSALARALPDGTRCLAGCGINHTYQYGVTHPELYPDSDDPGTEAMRDAVEGFTGLEVSATVSIRMTGFVDLIDALGGVSVVVTRPVLQAGVPDDGSGRPVEYGPPIPAGLQHLDGSEALWFARSRVNTSDADRSERQACLQAALFRQVDPITVLTRFTEIARSGTENVSTTLPAESLPSLARLADAARSHPLLRVELGEPLTLPEQPDMPLVHRTVADAVAGGDETGATQVTVPGPGAPVEAPAVTTPPSLAGDADGPACSVP